MAAAMARGWAGEFEQMLFSDSGSGRAGRWPRSSGARRSRNAEIAARADLVVLAVKPDELDGGGAGAGAAREVVSVLAATPLERLRAALPAARRSCG